MEPAEPLADPDASEMAAGDVLIEALVAGEEAPLEMPAAIADSKTPLMSLDFAREKIGSAILEMLDLKFNGSLTEVRYPDEQDRLF